jgi:large subunit ribosomal protein LP2
MRHLAAYLLLVAGGNTSPSAEDIKTLMGKVGIDADEERLNQLLTDLEGKDVNELIALGKERLVTAGGAAAAAGPAAAGGAPAAAGGAAEEKKPEKKEEVVDVLDGGMDMFGGGGGGGGDY